MSSAEIRGSYDPRRQATTHKRIVLLSWRTASNAARTLNGSVKLFLESLYGAVVRRGLKGCQGNSVAMDREEHNWYGAMLEYLGPEPGRRFMRRLATLDPVFHKGHTLIAQLMAAGEFSLAIVYPHRVESMKKQGAPIEWVPTTKPIIAEMGPVGIASKAPNPNSAKVLVDFILSREGQQLLRDVGRIVRGGT